MAYGRFRKYIGRRGSPRGRRSYGRRGRSRYGLRSRRRSYGRISRTPRAGRIGFRM